jgi:hypothetical protein
MATGGEVVVVEPALLKKQVKTLFDKVARSLKDSK